MASAQEERSDFVAPSALPTHNMIKYNRLYMNPTFSFVGERASHINAYNRRQWTSFNNSPLLYIVQYSGRLNEQMGAGLGLYQQNYGAFRYFGANANYAYNVEVNDAIQLTFGTNLNFYNQGVTDGAVATATAIDPFLAGVSKQFSYFHQSGCFCKLRKFLV